MTHCVICDPKSKYNECICNDLLKDFHETYENITAEKSEYFHIVKEWSISTMTMCTKFNSPINIDIYKNLYDIRESTKKFYNCINIYLGVKYQHKNKISAKIFTNGNIQLAGVLNVVSAAYAIRKIFNRLNKCGAFSNEAYISDTKICMINSDFKINKNIKQQEVCSIIDKNLTSYNILRYSFNPSKYPGINIKFLHNGQQTTCSMFRPGSIMITGGNNINNYQTILNCIYEFLENNNQVLY